MTLFAILLTFHYITAQFYDFLRIYQSDIANSYKKSRQEKPIGKFGTKDYYLGITRPLQVRPRQE